MAMGVLQVGTVGILPAGALGVAFFHHLTLEIGASAGRVHFFEREGSASALAMRGERLLRVGERTLDVAEWWRPSLVECFAAGWLPEVILVCTQPDQLLGMMRTIVRLLEEMHAAGMLDETVSQMPAIVLTSNGIYFQRVRQFFTEVLEEAIMFGRLPDLWEGQRMNRIVGKLLRGVTIQTGRREGSGAEAIYHPGPRGRTRLAGGETSTRTRVGEVLGGLCAGFEIAAQLTATRVEFDKALINLCSNLLGQLHAIDDAGRFRALKVREILSEEATAETRELAGHVIAVGRAVGAYGEDQPFEAIYAQVLEIGRQFLDHVPSSLQWIEQQLRLGLLEPRLTPTERWLLEPLIRYAKGAGLEEAAHYFERLTQQIEHRLGLAIQAAGAGKG